MSSSLKPKSYKLVFAGPVGAGKTTAIQSLSDIEVVRTEARASDDVKKLKDNTTVAMDYGLMKLASGDQVRLYGAPGQKRFDFMWEILTENALGLVLMLKASAPDPVADLRQYIQAFRSLIDETALVVGLTHSEVAGCQVRAEVMQELQKLGLPPVVLDADARNRAHMSALVKSLIFSIDPYQGAAAPSATA